MNQMNPSDAYRLKLITKLATLMAVIKVAIAKLEHSRDIPGADIERLEKIRGNLKKTLDICHSARGKIEAQMAGRLAEEVGEPEIMPKFSPSSGMNPREYVEMTSFDEYKKFLDMKPITSDEITASDLDELFRQLGKV